MKQSLFHGTDAYGNPIVHAHDPATSREAAAKHTASGKRNRNCDIVLALVQAHPDSTANELWSYASADEQAKLGDYYEVRRRLNDLAHARRVRCTGERRCRCKGSNMQVWA